MPDFHPLSSPSFQPSCELCREAGGTITDYSGKPGMLGNGEVIAGNETIHGQLLKVIKGVK